MSRQGPTRSDWLLAGAVLVAGELELVLNDIQPLGFAVTFTFVAAMSLAYRRIVPLVVVCLTVGATAASTWAGVPVNKPVVPILWIFISLYSVAAYSSLARALVGLALGLSIFASTLFTYSEDSLFGIAIIGSPWLVGRAMRSRLGEASELADQVADLQESRKRELREAAESERARIARDLHDVIAHSVSVMVVQAGAAAQVIERQPARAADALERIQDVGRSALTEVSALVGLLKEGDTVFEGSPHPGLAELPALLAHSTDSGVAADLVVIGEPRRVPPGLQLSIYRVVQEALTNTRKHSNGAHAQVRLTYAREELLVDVVDDGDATGDGPGGKLGMVGMVERMAAYGGTVDAGARAGGGFAVQARVPLATS